MKPPVKRLLCFSAGARVEGNPWFYIQGRNDFMSDYMIVEKRENGF